MADRKISELTNLNSADVDDDNDELVIVDASAGQTKAITRGELFKGIDGDITLSGNVDGRDVANDGSKLDGIESGATADQTASEIKTAYESNANTNAFTDSEKTRLNDKIGKQYETRAAFVTDVGSAYAPDDGTVVSAEGLLYVADSAATDISDLSGWKPFGRPSPDHFASNSLPGVTDMTDALNDAFSFASSDVSGEVGLTRDVRITDKVELKTGVSLDLAGYTLDASTADTTGTNRPRALELQGTYATEVSLSSDATAGDTVINASSTGLQRDDMVIVGHEGLFDSLDTETQTAEMAFVQSSDATTVTLFSPLAHDYATADNAYIQKITPVENVTIKNGALVGPQVDSPTKNYYSVRVEGGKAIRISNVFFRGASHADVSFVDCVRSGVSGCDFELSNENLELAYAISFANATADCYANSNTFNNRRHCISTNNESDIGRTGRRGVVSRIKFEGNVVQRSADYDDSDAANVSPPLDTHTAARNIEFSNNTIYYAVGHGINIECASAVARGNIIYNALEVGIRAHNESDYHGEITIEDNEIHKVGAGEKAIIVEEGFRNAGAAGYSHVNINRNKIYQSGGGIYAQIDGIRAAVNATGNMVLSDADGLAIIGEAKVVVAGNNVLAGADAIQLNDTNDIAVTGNIAETTSTTNRPIICLNTINGNITGNTCKVPDGSSSDGIIVTKLGVDDSDNVGVFANTLIAGASNTGAGITTGDGNFVVGPNLIVGFDTEMNLGSGTTAYFLQSNAEDTTSGALMPVGAFGLGSFTGGVLSQPDANAELPCGFYGGGGSGASNFPGASGFRPFLALNRRSNSSNYMTARIFIDSDAVPVVRESIDSGATWSADNTLWGTANTTVDGSGFILEASPIVRVHPDSIDEPNTPVGATLTHNETGVYVLSDVEPLATEGWQVRTPSDFNGNKVVAITEPEYDVETRTLTLRTHDLLWHEGRLVPGDPMDIPAGHFVMLRFHEPETPDPAA